MGIKERTGVEEEESISLIFLGEAGHQVQWKTQSGGNVGSDSALGRTGGREQGRRERT